ncbi:hypothetical protein [Lonepinella koalarum]|uniref:hypothetical protein n=1 Tax=Lonepinella koalarum TaxID=53417 RepID=UPI003F6E34DC
MAIADIGRNMAMYAQPTEFDQNAWKQAFDIANQFTATQNNRTTAEDNMRKLAENYATQNGRVNALNAQNKDLINQYGWNTTTRNATQQATIDNSLSQLGLNTQQNQLALSGLNDQAQLNQVQQQAILAGQNPDYAYLLNPEIAKQFSPALTAQLYGNQQQAQAAHYKNLDAELADVYKNSFVESYDPNTGNKITTFDPERFNQHTKALYARHPNDGEYIGSYFSRFNGYFTDLNPPQNAEPVITGYTQPPIQAQAQPQPQAQPTAQYGNLAQLTQHYGENFGNVATQWQQALGLNEQQAIQTLATALQTHSPEQVMQSLNNVIADRQREDEEKNRTGQLQQIIKNNSTMNYPYYPFASYYPR